MSSVYAELIRPNVCILSALGILIGAIVAGAFNVPVQFVLAAITAFVITGAGNVVNDYFDTEIDSVNRPKRPIPSGRIPRKGALNYFIFLNLIGLSAAYFVNLNFFLIAIANTAVSFAYSWKFKKVAVAGNICVSWLACSTFIAAGLLVENFSTILASPIITLSAISFFGTMSREVFKTIEDVKGDKKGGAKTLPIIIGEQKSRIVASVFLLLACLMLALPILQNIFKTSYYLVGSIPAIILCLYALTTPAAKSQKLVKISMYFVFLGFVLGSL